ncbi:MAG: extracellular solute-binding protein [Lachnospiraceae bacterium]|nr:extracellular solute-binding protein [Lachnospiraceae bacterium]
MNITEIFLTMVNRSITAGIVILAVLLVRAFLGRLNVPRRYIYLLWLIPALRLLCPVTLSSVTSLFNLPVFDRAVQTETGLTYLPEELTELAQSGEQPGETMGSVQNGSYGMGAVRRDIGEPANYYGGRIFDLPPQRPEREDGSDSLAAAELSDPVDWGRMALHGMACVWLAGMAFLAFRQLYAYGRIRRQVACAVRLEDESGGNVYECEKISTPFTMGALRGRIYLPCHMAEEEQKYVLLHERYHIRRHDLRVRLLACVLQVVYWYNPLVWVAVRCMERDMEMRCDEYVLEQMGEDIRYDYSLSLLSYAAGRRYRPLNVAAFGESGTGKRVKHVLKYKKTGICIIALAVVAILAASVVCLTDRKPREENLPEETDSVEKTYFWGRQELQIQLGQGAAPAMSLAGRSIVDLPSATEAGDYGSGTYCVGEHCFFLMRPLYAEDAVSYEMQVFDGDRKEWSSGFLELELLEQGYLYSMFAVSDEEIVYLITVMDGRQYEAYYAVHVNRAGEELKRVDLLPICQELNMIQEQVPPTNICVDSQGNYYIVSFDGKQMAILDGEGNLLGERDCSVRYKKIIPWMTAGPDGGILTHGYHETDGMEWVWLEGEQEKHLGGVQGGSFSDRIIPLDNGIYYYITGEKKIYQGDEKTGDAEFLFDAGNIIGTWGEVTVNGEGEVLLFVLKDDCAVAYVLNRAGETEMGEGGESILITDPLYATSIANWQFTVDIENTLPIFMAEHPEYAFDLQVVPETTREERSAVHDRVWSELIAGKGPDIFFIDKEDLDALWEKGVLMDLRELVSQETLDQIYPGLLATGTIDGSLAGVSTFYNINSMVTSTEIWPEAEWTVEEMVALLEAGEYPKAFNRMYGYVGDSLLVYMLTCYDMAGSPFIDWDAGTCSFDSDLFIRLLNAAKQYRTESSVADGGTFSFSIEGMYEDLLDGNCLAVVDIVADRGQFVTIKQFMGDKYNRPGIPGDGGSSQVVNPIGFYVVNRNCKNKEAAAAYLEFLMSAQIMGDYRRDCRDTFEVVRDWEGKWAIIKRSPTGGYEYHYLLKQNDPAIFSEEMPECYVEYLECCEAYYAYMESLEGQSPVDSRIEDIIEEEIASFFGGNQSAEHVADVIQRRVQLYLSEQQ